MDRWTHQHLPQEQIHKSVDISERLKRQRRLKWREAAVSFFRSWIEMIASEINHASNRSLNTGKHEYYYSNIR